MAAGKVARHAAARRGALRRGAEPLLLAALLGAAPVAAELGGARASVDADRAHLAAAMTSAPAAGYTVHTLTLANGGTAREYEAGGAVFAVAWRGPGRPDLRQLLGPSFATLQAEVAVARRGRRRPLMVRHDDLVVHSAGHPGAFWGYAYLPALVRAGFPADALH